LGIASAENVAVGLAGRLDADPMAVSVHDDRLMRGVCRCAIRQNITSVVCCPETSAEASNLVATTHSSPFQARNRATTDPAIELYSIYYLRNDLGTNALLARLSNIAAYLIHTFVSKHYRHRLVCTEELHRSYYTPSLEGSGLGTFGHFQPYVLQGSNAVPSGTRYYPIVPGARFLYQVYQVQYLIACYGTR